MNRPGLKDRIYAFCQLGTIMLDACLEKPGSRQASELREIAWEQNIINPWFTPESVFSSINAIASDLNEGNLTEWLSKYKIPEINDSQATIGIIMAGNIPLVGFHDFLSVLISGNSLLGKTSSKDRELICKISSIIKEIDNRFEDLISLSDSSIDSCDAIIATGSNNSLRYFEYSYGSIPHIFRNNRNSVALIDNKTSEIDLRNLGHDVFDYYGLGCRNVSKIYIPEEFDLERLKNSWKEFSHIMDVIPYRNNYNYQKALLTSEENNFIDLENLLLIESRKVNSPVAVLNYELYKNIEDAKSDMIFNSDKIQIVLGTDYNAFGTSQSPGLSDYADGIDTLDFLLTL